MLGSVNLTPNLWPTAAVIDWLNILRRVDGIPEQAKRQDEVQQILQEPPDLRRDDDDDSARKATISGGG